MFSSSKTLIVAAALMCATPLAAQETAGEAATDLNLGAPVAAEPQVGQPFIREVNGDWAIRCLKAEEGSPDPCQLYQLLSDEDGNAVAEISMFPIAGEGQAAAGATIVVPLETLLTEQLTLSVDGGAARTYPFNFCNAAGCVARLGFTDETVTAFKRGNTANLRIVPAAAPDQPVNLTISLTGFTAGFDAAGN